MRFSVLLLLSGCVVGVGSGSTSFGTGWSGGAGGSTSRDAPTAPTDDAAVTTGTEASGDDAPTDGLSGSSGAQTSGVAGSSGTPPATSGVDASTGADGGACATPAVVASVEALFFDCDDAGRIGQGDPVGGITCEQVCCIFGYEQCLFQAEQDVPFFCVPTVPASVGDCDDVFPDNWTYQCLCD